MCVRLSGRFSNNTSQNILFDRLCNIIRELLVVTNDTRLILDTVESISAVSYNFPEKLVMRQIRMYCLKGKK